MSREEIIRKIEFRRVDLSKKPPDLETQMMWSMWNEALDVCIKIVREAK